MAMGSPDARSDVLRDAYESMRRSGSVGALLEIVAQAAFALSGTRESWAARIEGAVITVVERAGDSVSQAQIDASVALVSTTHPRALSENAAVVALLGSQDEVLGVVGAAVRSGDPDGPLLMHHLGSLALVAAIALDNLVLRERARSTASAHEMLLASTAHDLRSPLNTFAMSSGLLRDDIERREFDEKRALGLLSRMDRATSRMQRLIEDVMDASRVESRKVELIKRKESADKLVRDAIAATATLAQERSVTFAEGTLEEAFVLVDRARLIQAIGLLLGYATRTIGEGGSVRVSATREAGAVMITLRIAVPASRSPMSFDETRGGLSLFLARGLIEAHGAKVSFDPDGSSMSFRVAVAP